MTVKRITVSISVSSGRIPFESHIHKNLGNQMASKKQLILRERKETVICENPIDHNVKCGQKASN